MPANGQFQSTRWSLVLAAKDAASPAASDALAQLCETYWYPLFAYVRRQGYDAVQAQDLVQGLFLSLLERDFLKNVEQGRGRFRHYLLAACKNYLALQHRNARTQKRGGGRFHLSLDFVTAEKRYQGEHAHEASADQLFEYRWAVTLVERVVHQLADESRRGGKGPWFEQLRGYLDGSNADPYRDTASRLGTTEGAVKVAVHRLRQQFATHFRREIEQTLDGHEDVDEEIRAVFRALTLGR